MAFILLFSYMAFMLTNICESLLTKGPAEYMSVVYIAEFKGNFTFWFCGRLIFRYEKLMND